MLTMYAGEVVEDGPVEAILLAAAAIPIPRACSLPAGPGARRNRALPSIPGRVPSSRDMPAGCRFAPRCTYAVAGCGQPQALARRRRRHGALLSRADSRWRWREPGA